MEISSAEEFEKVVGRSQIYYLLEVQNSSSFYTVSSVTKKYLSFIPDSESYLFYNDIKDFDLFYSIDKVDENRVIVKGINAFYCLLMATICSLSALLIWTIILLFFERRPVLKIK